MIPVVSLAKNLKAHVDFCGCQKISGYVFGHSFR
jgi:hypothetical protein